MLYFRKNTQFLMNMKQSCFHLDLIIKRVVQNIARHGKYYIIIGEQTSAACASERQVKQSDIVPKLLSLIYVTANLRNQIIPGIPNPFREFGESLK